MSLDQQQEVTDRLCLSSNNTTSKSHKRALVFICGVLALGQISTVVTVRNKTMNKSY